MVKVFGQTDTDFSSNGDAVLHPFKAKIHKEDNGDFYLELDLPLEYEQYLIVGNIVTANTPQGDQAFRIGNMTKTHKKISTKCWHVFYDTRDHLFVYQIPEMVPPAETCAHMVNRLNTSLNLYPTSPFTVSSDITRESIFSAQYCSYYDALMGIVNNFGAHLVRDNFTIAVNDSIGEDKGVTIRYGVNMKDITKVENWDEVCTRLYAFGKDGTRLTSYRESSTQYTLKYTKMITFSQDSIKREYYATKADYEAALYSDLLTTANKYVAAHCVPQVSYTLKAQPEVVSDIGDTFRVIDETLGVDLLTAVHAYDYDCLTERYISVEFGNAPRSARGMGFSLLKLRTLYDTSVIGNRQLTFDDDGTVKWVSV